MRSQLPQAPQSSLKLSAPTPFTSRQEPYRILVAEDNPNNRMLLREYLAPLGFEIQEVDNGAAAIALWRQWRPHLIWMDIRMPKLDGQAATRRIRQIETDLGLEPTVIVALTANAFEENRQEILAAGCDHLIRKPFQADHLFAVLAQYLGMTLCGGSNPVSTQSAETATLTPEALQKMPTIWVQSLHEAACQCSDTKVNALIKEIPTAQADVAEVLSCWTNVFQFDRIVAVTTPLLSQVESLPQGR
ncbi:MAG TPA: response regulator [Trichocoleus sp.]